MNKFIFLGLLALSLNANNGFAGSTGSAFSYQGELTDNGSPANGDYDITVSLFESESGGSAITDEFFFDTPVVNGFFNLEVDFGDLVYQDSDQFYFEIEITPSAGGASTVLAPRNKLLAVPYALYAEMVSANAIGSNELANSAVDTQAIQDSAVTYEKLAAQSVGLTKIRADEVQARVTGSCSAGSHATAINENGSIQCDHDNTGLDAAGAVAAVLAADGSGSGLDADLLDGQNAADIIDAAGASSAIEIDSLPLTINQSGSYIFTQNLQSTSLDDPGIYVTASFVTIDFNGYTMRGRGSVDTQPGIAMSSGDAVTIKNGVIRDFGGAGISAGYTLGAGHQIINMRIINNRGHGINLAGDGHMVSDNIVDSNAFDGIDVSGAGSIVIGNTSTNNGMQGIIANGGVLAKNNSVFNNGESGISLTSGSRAVDNVVRGNNTTHSLTEGGIVLNGHSIAVNNTIDANNEQNVYIANAGGGGNVVDNNFITNATTSGSNNRGFGIYAQLSNSVYRDNILRSNVAGSFGGLVPDASRLIDNIEF